VWQTTYTTPIFTIRLGNITSRVALFCSLFFHLLILLIFLCICIVCVCVWVWLSLFA